MVWKVSYLFTIHDRHYYHHFANTRRGHHHHLHHFFLSFSFQHQHTTKHHLTAPVSIFLLLHTYTNPVLVVCPRHSLLFSLYSLSIEQAKKWQNHKKTFLIWSTVKLYNEIRESEHKLRQNNWRAARETFIKFKRTFDEAIKKGTFFHFWKNENHTQEWLVIFKKEKLSNSANQITIFAVGTVQNHRHNKFWALAAVFWQIVINRGASPKTCLFELKIIHFVAPQIKFREIIIDL